MKSILALLLSIPLLWARVRDPDDMMSTTGVPDTRVCYKGAARVAFSVENDRTQYAARARIETCPTSEYGCGAVRKFGVSIQYEPNDNGVGGTVVENGTRVGYSSLDLGCVRPAVCEAITGDSNGACRSASYNYVRYAPQSCDANNNYDPEYYFRSVRLYYGCCNGENRCVDASRDSAGNSRTELNDTCTENEALGNYLQELQECFQEETIEWRRYLLCNDGLPLSTYRGICLNQYGEWDRAKAADLRQSTACYYRRTCSARLITILKAFSECACSAAKTHGFSGRAITSLMEDNWNDYCPGIDLTCDVDNDYAPFIRRRLKKRRIRLRIKRAIADITDAIKATLRTKICMYLRRLCTDDEDEETVTVTATRASDDDTTRRRMVDAADPDTESDIYFDIYGDDGFDTGIDDAACSSEDILNAMGDEVTGGEATVISCDSDDAYFAEFGTNPDGTTTTSGPDDMTTTEMKNDPTGDGGDGFMIGTGFAFIMTVFGYIMQ